MTNKSICDACKNKENKVVYSGQTVFGCFQQLCEKCFEHLGTGLYIDVNQAKESALNLIE